MLSLPAPFRALPVLAALLAIAPSSASAAADDMLVYLDGGAAWPVHPAEFGEFWHAGWSVGAGLGIPLAPEWQLNGNFHYHRHGADGGRQAGDLLLSGPGGITLPVAFLEGRDLTLLTLMAELRFLVPTTTPSRTWFLAFGFGAGEVFTGDATVTADDPTMEPILIVGESDAAFASSMGGGLEIDLSDTMRLTVDSIYTLVFTEDTSTQFLPLRLGLAWRIR